MGLATRSLIRSYEIEAELGSGGMGAVYRARNRLTGEQVALKRIHMRGAARRAQQTAFRLAFAREFQSLASLRHPNVIHVIDYGFDYERMPFFTMELIAAPQGILQAAAGSSREARCDYLIQLLRALAYVHRRGVVHRDIKPQNIFVAGGVVKLLDFGIASRERDAGDLSGTVEYMAPELFVGESATPASDLYSVGVVAYQLFTGRLPFATDSLQQFLSDVLGERAEQTLGGDWAHFLARQFATFERQLAQPLSERRAEDYRELEPAIREILQRLLAPAPQRYRSAAAVIDDLCRALGAPALAETEATRESYLQAATFVGRAKEMNELEAALERANGGHGSGWLLGAESGGGKTRLLNEFRTHALVSGVEVLRGKTTAEAGGLAQVWTPVLRALVFNAELTDQEASILKDLIADIDALIGRVVPLPPQVAPQLAQARLFAAIEALFARQSEPVLVILEDLQWAESDTLALLGHLAPTLGDVPVMLVGSYRDDERIELPALLPRCQVMKLSRLGTEEIGQLSASMLGQSGARREIVDYLNQESEGNAFFLVEIARRLIEEWERSGGAAPELGARPLLTHGMEDLLASRIERVCPSDRALLALAAVAGRQLDEPVLARLAPEVALEDWLASCANAAIVEVTENTWHFSHDKLREYILRQISPADLVAHHRTVAQAIEAEYAGRAEKYPLLAYHYLNGAVPQKAFDYSIKTGDAAARFFNTVDAREHYQHALRMLDELPDTPENRRQRVDTLTKLVSVSWFAARPEVTLERMSVAESLLAAIGDSAGNSDPRDELRLARVLLWRGSGYHVRGEPQRAIESYERAIPIARKYGDKVLALSLAGRVGQSRAMQGYPRKAEPYLVEALEPLEKAENWAEWVRMKGFHGTAMVQSGRYQAGLAAMRDALHRAEAVKNLQGQAAAWLYMSFAGLCSEGWRQTCQAAEAAVRLAKEASDPMYELLALRFALWGYSYLGNLARLEPYLERARAFQRKLGRTICVDLFATCDAELVLNRGDLDGVWHAADAAWALAEECDGPLARGWIQRTRARAWALKDAAAANVDDYFADSIRIHDAAGLSIPAARTRLWWSRCLAERGALAEAESLRREAVERLRQCGVDNP
jgi:tRNA A-37 threonylcarbamoyl transferase component Bud32